MLFGMEFESQLLNGQRSWGLKKAFFIIASRPGGQFEEFFQIVGFTNIQNEETHRSYLSLGRFRRKALARSLHALDRTPLAGC